MILHQEEQERTKLAVCSNVSSDNQHTSLVNSNAPNDYWTGLERLCSIVLAW
jgi:hypothetical protein